MTTRPDPGELGREVGIGRPSDPLGWRIAARAAAALAPLEDRLALRAARTPEPAVFIVGPPRSGTTLMYQIMIHRFAMAYFDNWCSRFPRTPILAARAEAGLAGTGLHRSDFTSLGGRTRGLRGPSEFGALWYRWFPAGDDVYVPPGATGERALAEIRGTCAAVSRIAKRPLVVKNTFNSMRVAPILEAVPEVAFLVMRRDLADTAASLLQIRIDLRDDVGIWMGVPPRQIRELKQEPPWNQVVDQVFFIERQLEEDRERFGAERFVEVEYERLCADPRGEMERIERFLRQRGIEVCVAGEIPTRFPQSRPARLGAEYHERILRRARERSRSAG